MSRYRYWQERPCQVCGKSIKGKRGDAKYCSANCRKQASRWAAQLNQIASDIAHRIGSLQEYLDDKEQAFRARGVLRELQFQIGTMLNVTAASVTDSAAPLNVTHRLGTDKDGQSDV
jgi:hypothetical protein